MKIQCLSGTVTRGLKVAMVIGVLMLGSKFTKRVFPVIVELFKNKLKEVVISNSEGGVSSIEFM